jgi:diguanylate cyclase (GGDEF)-like protein
MESLQPFRHILVIEDQKAKRIVALENATYSVGRESSNDIVIYDRVVSRHHATLLKIKSSPRHERYFYRIIDGDLEGNKSTNGLIVNGKRRESYNLKHGDAILFGEKAKVSYYVLSNSLDIALFNPIEVPQQAEFSEATVSWSDNFRSTAIKSEKLEQLGQDDLMRLASFPELSPNPIIEMNFAGNLTYLNPAANFKFRTIQQAQLEHPVLTGLLDRSQNLEGNLLLREVQVGQEVFEQYVHYLSEYQLIRSYLFDVTERKRAQETLQHQAFHDLLTELPNRTLFDKQLAIALANARRNQALMAVMFLDLDGFKNINDSLGHSVGDRILQSFAKRLSGCLRGGDILSRWGGDEFTVLLPQIRSAEDTIEIAQRILSGLKHPFEISEHQLYIKTSIGIALYPQDGEDSDTLLKHADAALYKAKEQGRDRYRFYSSSMSSKATLLAKFEGLLRQALENNQLSLQYQPQVKLKTGTPTGMEALLRWSHPEIGNVAPLKLISLAEETNLLFPLSEWILQTACQQNKLWQQLGLVKVPVTVNLSPRQLLQPDFFQIVTRILQETGLEAQWLELEITEEAIAHHINAARQILENLRQIGVRIALDNFGAGNCSLSYLQSFPLQTLKTDRSAIASLKEHPQNFALVSALVAAGNSFNLRVVAEGIETLQQLELLIDLQCEEGQGYWFSYPLNVEEARQFLASR